ncbi:MAG: DUF4956 domain-containing protein [Actinomycetota bacterium]|nr:DUF4956 domain-containing protein [Actinomycetota bacterium]
MSYAIAYTTDLIGITILAYVIYFRRHFRRDLLLSYVALNVGILSVMTILTSVDVGVGLGLGLFGILSIIRLRSDQITQGEIAYYFISLTLGLLAGLHPANLWLVPAMTVGLLTVMYVADHPRLLSKTKRQILTLDNAYVDEASLIDALCIIVRGEVRQIVVMEIDLVRDITVVDVRYVVSVRPKQSDSPITDPVPAAVPAGRRVAL